MNVYLSQAVNLHRKGSLDDADQLYQRALTEQPENTELLYLSALCQLQMGRFAGGAEGMREVIKRNPRHAAAHHALGKALIETASIDDAERHLRAALKLDPALVDSQIELAAIQAGRGRLNQAERLYRDAIEKTPGDARLYNNLGDILRRQKRDQEAFQAWQKAVEKDASFAYAYSNMALHMARTGRVVDALDLIKIALQLEPKVADFHFNLGMFHFSLGRHDDAVEAFEEAHRLEPGNTLSTVRLAQAYHHLCDWHGRDQFMPVIEAEIENAVAGRPCNVSPVFSLVLPISENKRRAIAEAMARKIADTVEPIRHRHRFRHKSKAKKRLRIGYMSADWHDHANSHLICGLFEHHDRSAFDVSVFAIGRDDDSHYSRRIREGCDRYVDLRTMDHGAAAQEIYDRKIDILLDVQGYDGPCRPEILALRPAPIQISFQYFLGTTGAPWMDYMIVDDVMVPRSSRRYFSESLIYMPDCYQVTDDQAPVAARRYSRESQGLPSEGVVFASFSAGHKIDQQIFRLWMRVLRAVPGSCLWLSGGSESLQKNLCCAANADGVAAERLVFAPRVPEKADHLARLPLADLFLDTPHYGAFVSAVDSLYMATPVLTRHGDAFSSRGAVSMLLTQGVTELVVDDFESYEAKAIELGRSPDRLKSLRRQLKNARETMPLFDTAKWSRNVEAAYRAVWDRYVANERSSDIVVTQTCIDD